MNRKLKKKERARRRASCDVIPFPGPPDSLGLPGKWFDFDSDVPPPLQLLRLMVRAGLGPPGAAHVIRARELVSKARRAQSPDEATRLALEALELDENSLEARMLLAIYLSSSEEEFILRTRSALRAIERRAGPGVFDGDGRDFWDSTAAEGYLKARFLLGGVLAACGRIDEEIHEYERMLELDPLDTMDVQHRLLGRYLEVDRLEDARRLFDEHGPETCPVFAWGRVLERWLSADLDGAAEALREARGTGSFAEAYLTGKQQPPHAPGSDDWAFSVESLSAAWSAHPDAVEWLRRAG